MMPSESKPLWKCKCNGPVVEAGQSLSSNHLLLTCSLVVSFPVASSNEHILIFLEHVS